MAPVSLCRSTFSRDHRRSGPGETASPAAPEALQFRLLIVRQPPLGFHRGSSVLVFLLRARIGRRVILNTSMLNAELPKRYTELPLIIVSVDQRTIIANFKDGLRAAGFEDRQIAVRYSFADIKQGRSERLEIPLAAFSRNPRSYRTACIGMAFSTPEKQGADLAMTCRSLGAPLFFEVNASRVQPWSIGAAGASPCGPAFSTDSIEKAFKRHKAQWTADVLGRVKRTADVVPEPQLELFQRGLLPVLEKFFRSELKTLLECAFTETADCFRRVHSAEPDVRSLFPFLFRFVTAKIFMDRADAKGWDNLGTPRQIFEKAEVHSGSDLLAKLPRTYLDRRILAHAWESISGTINFQNIAVADLAEIYESAFITEKTRKELGVHSTPHGLADYIVQHLPWKTLPIERRRVFEPFSGHAMLLAAAMARLGEDLDPDLPPAKRHDYFRRRLTGVEKDPFAIEVSRLLLTLSDYPNHNSWNLHHDDVFKWKGWDDTLSACDVVLANPPYEPFTAAAKRAAGAIKANPPAEFLHRVMRRPPAMLGLILPQSFLSSPFFRDASRQIARSYDEVRIVELPKLFRYADNETIALLAHGRRDVGERVAVHYSEVLPTGLDAFLNDFKVSHGRAQTLVVPEGSGAISFRLPPQGSMFERMGSNTKLGEVAKIRQGLHWKPRTDGKPQSADREDVASNRPKKGYLHGCEKMAGNLSQFHVRRLRYLSALEDDHHPRDAAWRNDWGSKKVACNAARFAAFADHAGLAFTKQFFVIWPQAEVSEFALAAVLNSPIGNSFSFLHDLERHNHIETLNKLPLPALHHLSPGKSLDKLAREVQLLFSEEALLGDFKIQQWQEALLRLDAAVLDAYELPAEAQRQLLDQFAGETRPVSFEFNGYFPDHFKDAITLSDFVAIQYDWDKTNELRCDLIDKELTSKGLKPDERKKLDHLQHLADLMVRLKDPYPLADLDEMIVKLKAEGKWRE
jgi:N-6 DNA Methylase